MSIDVPGPTERLTGATSLGEIALRSAERHVGDALTAPASKAVSYAELGLAARDIAGGLAELGIEVGDYLVALVTLDRVDVLDRDLTQADGELTPTLKVKRAVSYERYADRFGRLYDA